MKNIKLKELSLIATTLLTAFGACYAGLAQIWGFPYADQVVSSIAVIVSLISAVLGAFTMKKISDRSASNTVMREIDTSQEETIENDIAIPKGENG